MAEVAARLCGNLQGRRAFEDDSGTTRYTARGTPMDVGEESFFYDPAQGVPRKA